MLQKIKISFFSQSFELAIMGPWLTGTIVLCLIIIGLLIFISIRAKRKRYIPYGSIVDEKQIRSILRTTLDQRRPLELQIVMDDANARRPTLRCSPEYVGSTSLTIEVNGITSLSKRWIGREVQVFFRIKNKDEFTYFTFDSTIEGISTPQSNVCYLVIAIPKLLDNRQKRSFLRLAPPPELILGSAIWHHLTMPQLEHLHDLALWPQPLLLLIPKKIEEFQIVDLSAGGIRICVPRQTVREHNLEFASVEQFILLLDLYDPEQAKRIRCWLQCRIQSVWEEHLSRDTYVGAQFLAWAKPREHASSGSHTELEWLRLSHSSEVESIGNWIMRRHLELFREIPHDMEEG